MAHLKPVRDAAGTIIGLTPRDARTPQFSQMLAETMHAVGAAPASASAQAPADGAAARPFRLGRVELAALLSGLVVALILIALITRVTPAQDGLRAPAQPLATLGTLPTG